ncbi:hypothetical protein B0F90DRAFT_1817351 [Multifurca ochricompacta]|uniref:Uncharacterized protein n=1 Tax=Multifurca ochricompacta TaxID=376703 RepID=A0AAD4M404_9AGAM|nr:hypothetical protein B0F90DRAFT_1817351 [Multifurca ochricompacta]
MRYFEASAKKQHWIIDARALTWTLDFLDLNHELEQFTVGIPGLFLSKAVEQPEERLACISESSTPHPNLGNDLQKLDTVFHSKRYTIGSCQCISGSELIVPLPSFRDSYESWAIAESLRQDPGLDSKI